MRIPIGRIEALYRYPVKSMRGEPLAAVPLGWRGLEGDRRLALRRTAEHTGFPWLVASRLADLVRYTPQRDGGRASGPLPTHVLTPEGERLPAFGEALAADVGRRFGAPVEMMRLDHGVFDEGIVSVISEATVGEVCRLAGRPVDVRRFRPNVLVRTEPSAPFEEDAWVGGVLVFGESDDAPALHVTARDVRCSMVNIDPDDASLAPEVLKAVVRANRNHAGIYATVARTGPLAVGQPVVLHR